MGFKNLGGKAGRGMGLNRTLRNAYHRTRRRWSTADIPGETVSRMKADLSLSDNDSLATETLGKVYKVLGSDVVVLGSYLDMGGQIRVDFRVQDSSGRPSRLHPSRNSISILRSDQTGR